MTTTNATPVHYHAGHNMPGYLPESDVETFATFADAKSHTIYELNYAAENVATWADEHDCDDVPCPTYGDDCPHDQANALSLVAEDLNLDNGPEWGDIVAGLSWWITECHEDGCEVEEEGDDFDAADYIVDAAALTTCSACGERHWYLTDTDGMSHMASLPGYTCGQEDDEEPADGATRASEPTPATTTGHPGTWPKTPTMSRQDFAYLARVLADLDFTADEGDRGPGSIHRAVVEHLAYHLADTCARFDRERFVAAAGGGLSH